MKDNIIGRHVKYYDYLGLERFGTIVAIEPYSEDQVFCYIEDDDPDYNINEDFVNGVMIVYADLRISTEVYIDE